MLIANKEHIRHGDVNIAPTKKRKGGKKANSFVLAEGETSGHFHKLTGSVAVLTDDKTYFEALGDVELDHPEHGKVKVKKGAYKVWIERERDPYMDNIRRVLD